MRRAGSVRPALTVAPPRVAFACALLSFAGCAPAPSTVPLGRGPLAIAEQEAEARAAAERQRAPARARRARPEKAKAPEAVATADGSSKPAGETPAAEKGAEKKDGEPEPAGTGKAAFEGLYAGDDIAVFRISGFPDREQRDDKAKIRIEAASGDNVGIILINSEDGSDLCEILARVDGNAALIESAQPCFSDGGEGSLEAELTSGRAVLDGDRLRMDAEGTLSVALPDQQLDGELSYSFKGERQ